MRRTGILVAGALACGVAASSVGAVARAHRARWPALIDEPYAPSPGAAPFVTLGYREAAADLLWIRALGYFGGDDDTADGVRALIEAIVALDPQFRRAYTWGALAVNNAAGGDRNEAGLWAVDLLERGMAVFPDSWEMPITAGQILVVDLQSDDKAQVAAWRDRGAQMLERGVRIPGAPEGVATLAATVRTELGQHARAVRELKEMILLAKDERAREKLIGKLAKLEASSADRLRAELLAEHRRFQSQWLAERPELPATMYVLLGPRLPSSFSLDDLAVDRELIGADDQPVEVLPPLPDDAVGEAPEAAPAAPAGPPTGLPRDSPRDSEAGPRSP
jgi:hypothetical protein